MRSSRERMLCTSCHARILIQPFCSSCGNPTTYASQEERIEWELQRWSGSRRPAPQPPRPSTDPRRTAGNNVIDLAALERKDLERARPNGNGNGKRPAQQKSAPQPTSRPERRPERPAAPLDAPANRRERKRLRAQVGPRAERWRRVLPLLPEESVHIVKEGRCGPDRATLVMTRFRIALVAGAHVRWIPLESVDLLEIVEGRSARLGIGGSVEYLAFSHPDRAALEVILATLQAEVALAHMPGDHRHHPDVMQAWAQRIAEMWKANFRGVRHWLRRHPGAAAILR